MGLKLSDKAKGALAAIAPTLGAALGGPLGGLAGNVLANALGGKPELVEKALISQNPDILLRIKEAESQFQIKLRELDISEEEIHAKDRQSARDLAKIDMRPQMALSALFVGGYFTILGLLLSGYAEIPDMMREPLLVLIGVITANVPSIMQFWFGSSMGSKEKTAAAMAHEPR